MESGVRDLLKSREMEDRLRAVRRLSADPRSEHLTLLVGVLRDRARYVAGLAAAALAEHAEWDHCAGLLTYFEHAMTDDGKRDPGCTARCHIAIALGRHRYAPASDALRAGIRWKQVEAVGGRPVDTAVPLRANCALALAEMCAPDALRDISLLLFEGATEDNLPARVAAARALARLGEADCAVPLSIMLRAHPGADAEMLSECMQALAHVEDPRLMEFVEPYLDHPDEPLAAMAAITLGALRTPEAAHAIIARATRFRRDCLDSVMIALARCGVDAAISALKGFAADPRTAAAARSALAMIGVPFDDDGAAAGPRRVWTFED